MKLTNSFFAVLITTSIAWLATSCQSAEKKDSEVETTHASPTTTDSIALKRLIADATLALELHPFSVLDNPPTPPSGDKHDYYSWSAYYWPNPDTPDSLPYVYKDGKTNPATEKVSDKPLLRRMVMAVQTLALAYRYTNKSEYSNKATSILNTWFIDPQTKMNPNLNFAQCVPGKDGGQPYGVIDSRWFIVLVDAVDMLAEDKAIAEETLTPLKEWFGQYLDWLQTSESGKKLAGYENNIGSWYMAQKAHYALFSGQDELAKSFVEENSKFFTSQIDSIGRVVHELERTKSYDYSLYSINALLSILEAKAALGMDSHASQDNALLLSIKFMASHHNTGKEWPYPQIAEKAIALNYEDEISFSVYYPYDLYYTLKLGYKLFQDEALLEAMDNIEAAKRDEHRANLLY